MNNKEKYYKFIVDDLVRTTELLDYDGEIKLPWYGRVFTRWLLDNKTLTDDDIPNIFVDYIIEKYGIAKDEYEVIWRLYAEIVLSLITNEYGD